MEWAKEGTLGNFSKKLTDVQVIDFAIMMLLSFEYLNKMHNIQHRDLKPNNIMVDKI